MGRVSHTQVDSHTHKCIVTHITNPTESSLITEQRGHKAGREMELEHQEELGESNVRDRDGQNILCLFKDEIKILLKKETTIQSGKTTQHKNKMLNENISFHSYTFTDGLAG